MKYTYEQQWQKLTTAYLNNELRPFSSSFCLCGNLCDNSDDWFNRNCSHRAINVPLDTKHHDYGQYTGQELFDMEDALLQTIHKQCGTTSKYDKLCTNKDRLKYFVEHHPNFEDALFEGMCNALEVLRKIHESKGDETAKIITLSKRVLQIA